MKDRVVGVERSRGMETNGDNGDSHCRILR
jgi:hypothetical protein